MFVVRRRLLNGLEKLSWQKMASQFGDIGGLEQGATAQFDDFVNRKRKEQHFDAFDQRVERAYDCSVKVHTAEIWNGFKKRLRKEKKKFTVDVMREVERTIDERKAWLRLVWTQVDADYRSNDSQRVEAAANAIAEAFSGEGGDYMSWVYETKRNMRFLGEKGKAKMEQELDGAMLPNVLDEEVDKYSNLKDNMVTLESKIKTEFGQAGMDHWALLQQQKDKSYEDKLLLAADVYKKLLDLDNASEEAHGQINEKEKLRRIHEAQVKLQASMQLEEEREKMMDAHAAMTKQRVTEARKTERQQLLKALKLKEEGRTTDDVAAILKQDYLDKQVENHNTFVRREQRELQEKKRSYLTMIEDLEEAIERRDGARVMEAKLQDDSSSAAAKHATKSAGTSDLVKEAIAVAERRARERGEGQREGQPLVVREGTTRRALWDILRGDTWEDPTRVVHQARLDARETYSEVYRRTAPHHMRLGAQRHRTMGQFAGPGKMKTVLQNPNIEQKAFAWGMTSKEVHDLDATPGKYYTVDGGGYHVSNMETGDIDYSEEQPGRRGPVWRGPRLYKLGRDSTETMQQRKK